MAEIHIHLKKQHLIVFISLIAILGVVLVTNAFGDNYGDPEIMGHSANELEVDVGSNNQNLQDLFNSILDDSGNINYANTAGSANNIEWNNINSRPDVATETWVNNQDYATQDYVDNNAGNYLQGGHYGRCKGPSGIWGSTYDCYDIISPAYCGTTTTDYGTEVPECKCADGFARQFVVESAEYSETSDPILGTSKSVNVEGYYTCIKE